MDAFEIVQEVTADTSWQRGFSEECVRIWLTAIEDYLVQREDEHAKMKLERERILRMLKAVRSPRSLKPSSKED